MYLAEEEKEDDLVSTCFKSPEWKGPISLSFQIASLIRWCCGWFKTRRAKKKIKKQQTGGGDYSYSLSLTHRPSLNSNFFSVTFNLMRRWWWYFINEDQKNLVDIKFLQVFMLLFFFVSTSIPFHPIFTIRPSPSHLDYCSLVLQSYKPSPHRFSFFLFCFLKTVVEGKHNISHISLFCF